MRWTHYLAAVGLLGCIACGSDDGDSNADFENVVPESEALTVSAPNSRNQALSVVGVTSSYYLTTAIATRQVNGTIAGVLALVHAIAEQPPTTIEGNTAVWGPGSGDALDRNVYRLTATFEAGVYTYTFDYRAKADANGAFTTLLEGHSDPGRNQGKGDVTIDATAWARIIGRDCSRGDVTAAYDTTVEPQTLTVTFDDFRDCDDVAEYSATYYYDRSSDGSGNFQFVTNGDIQAGARMPAVNELLSFRSRWNADGAGRSDARISGGDLSLEGVAEVTASECWDTSFDLTFAITTPQVADLDHSAGAESACPSNMQNATFASDTSVGL